MVIVDFITNLLLKNCVKIPEFLFNLAKLPTIQFKKIKSIQIVMISNPARTQLDVPVPHTAAEACENKTKCQSI